jgi:transcriptional regulator with XRE-family HTH domain
MDISLSRGSETRNIGNMDATTLGAYVRARRLALGWTQKNLCDRSGVRQPVISDIERGRTARSDADIRRRLAGALGVTHLDLLIAAGELTREEARTAATPPDADEPGVAAFVRDVRRVDWSVPGRRLAMTHVLRAFLTEDAAAQSAAASTGAASANDRAARHRMGS